MHDSKYQCHMAAYCTHHQPTYFSQLLNRSHTKKPTSLYEKYWKNFLEKLQQNQKTEEKKDKTEEKRTRTGLKNKRGDSKVESNDSPEIPDRRETSDIPNLPSGDLHIAYTNVKHIFFLELVPLVSPLLKKHRR